MADVITRFKLETTQYDSKLRDAAKGISEVAHQAELAGQGFNNFSQKSVEAANALGQTASGATNAKDKVRDLVGSYNEAAKAYNKLTQEQQQSDFGKALAQSLTQLKDRITEAKQELYSMGDSTKNTGGIMDQLVGKLTVNIDALKLLNVGLGAAKAALDVAKDAFFASEATVDEWGCTMQSAQGLYEGFLNAINTGDISGYLSRMDEIVRAARAAYDEMDKLNTMKTIQAPGISKQQLENDRIRMMIQTGRYISPRDGRANAVWNGQRMKEGQLLTPDQIRLLEKQLQGGLQKMTNLVGNEVKQSGKAIDAYYNSLAKQNGMSLQEFKKGTSTWEEFSAKIRGYEEYKKWDREARAEFARQGGQGSVNFDKSNPFAEFKKWGIFRVDKMGENSYNELVGYIKQRDQQIAQMYGNVSQSFRAINRAEGVTTRNIMGGGSGGGGGRSGGRGGSTTLSPSEQAAKDIEKAQNDYADAISNAQQKLVENMMKSDEYDKQVLSGQQKLADAYLKAYNVTCDEKYLSAFRETATHVKEMQGVVDANVEAQKSAEHAARELEVAQKKLADAENTLAEAQKSGSAIQVYKAQKAVDKLKGNGPQDTGSMFGNLRQSIEAEIKFDQMKVDEATLHTLLTTAIQNGLDNITPDYAGLQKHIAQGIDIPNSTWESLQNEINENLKKLGIEPIKINFETGGIDNVKKGADATSKSMNQAASAISSVGSALQQIEDPTAKVMGIVAQAIATIALSFADALGEDRTTKSNIWAFIGASAASMGAMISAISQIHSATGYAEGGIVKGNTYSGDNILMPVDGGAGGYAGLNAGEIVLNKAAQGNLASQLQGFGGSMNLRGIIRGEDILVVADRSARRQGKGELLFWK